MKKIKILFISTAAGLMFACNDPNPEDPIINGEPAEITEDTDTSRSRFAADLDNLRLRIKSRMQVLDNQIEDARRERIIERNKRKLQEFDDKIANRERRRNSFKETLDRLEKQTAEGWQKFKEEVEEAFERDYRDTIRNKQM